MPLWPRKKWNFQNSFFGCKRLPWTPKALSTLAGMPVGHYQLFKFSLASEPVLSDNRIVLAPHFRLRPPVPFPPCVLERVMGTLFARQALPASVDRALQLHFLSNGASEWMKTIVTREILMINYSKMLLDKISDSLLDLYVPPAF